MKYEIHLTEQTLKDLLNDETIVILPKKYLNDYFEIVKKEK